MKVTFISCFLSPHQIPFSNEMYKQLGDNYKFISTEMLGEHRIKMGWDTSNKFPYEIKTYESNSNLEKAIKLVNESDVVIIGSASDKFIEERLKRGKLTFKYSERLYKEGLSLKKIPRAICGAWLHHGRFQKYPIYMLCASAYTSSDLAIFNNYKNRTYKWGYFPQFKEYNIKSLLELKKNSKVEILWVGRLISWKHAEDAVKIAINLNKEGYDFNLNIIGTGECENYLKDIIIKNKIEDKVKLLGAIHTDDIRQYMEKANIFLFTSDFNEGWGAVLNEAMNSVCAVVASHAIGSVPFLLKHGENGLIYRYGDMDDFYKNVKILMDDRNLQLKLGENAYHTLKNSWNEKEATKRFLELSKNLLLGRDIEFTDGPCSRAKILKNNWL